MRLIRVIWENDDDTHTTFVAALDDQQSVELLRTLESDFDFAEE